ISRALARRRVNVVEMDSHVSSAPMSAELLFHARIDAQIPEHTDLDELQDSLDEIADNMTLEIELERGNFSAV
ncbi:MAG: amino acid-binding protein, partial [Halieaceae bacterium]|nr:amino acid-binding protein [Halieaceae bacterium]